MPIRLLLAFALLASWSTPARAISLSARTNRLIDRLEQLGVVIDRLERCGPGAERAAYNMGVNRLCLSLGPLQRQREVEAYALQSQSGMVESLLARHC